MEFNSKLKKLLEPFTEGKINKGKTYFTKNIKINIISHNYQNCKLSY